MGREMLNSSIETLVTPRSSDLDPLKQVANDGFSISLLPTGAIFAMEHTAARAPHPDQSDPCVPGRRRHGAPVSADWRGRTHYRPIIGPATGLHVGVAEDRMSGRERGGVRHRVTLWLHPD